MSKFALWNLACYSDKAYNKGFQHPEVCQFEPAHTIKFPMVYIENYFFLYKIKYDNYIVVVWTFD